ncbi:glucokinase [Lysobacter sp. CFH 32150]|uniref:glucokinase n=1 Tax=Lysobacter sp. CFH 32150 TaxID=2927128 RepID=UPI001FA8050A|nr:glucokinase [Lysobacter sp. CFH 32150]MCI4569127.1 glucokinase [Lysobacter sp. CFH 32150]
MSPIHGSAMLRTQPFIAADVGGTHARVALVQAGDCSSVSVLQYRKYICAEHPSLAAILRDFAATCEATEPLHAAVAIAGLIDGDRLINTNLPWPVSRLQTWQEAGLQHLALINDFEAVACATPCIDPAEITLLCGPTQATSPGPTLVIGPGTGLGAAVRLSGTSTTILSTEAGHASLAPGTPRELELLRHLLQRWPHVDNERVLSGPGLLNTYTALCEIDGVSPRLQAPAEIAAAAQRGDDVQAVESLQLFCSLLGSLTGDLALMFGAKAVYLAGGIPAQIKPFLLASDFSARYRNKGALGEVLARVPVWLIEHGQLGLIGAAAWYLEHYGSD